MKTAISVPDDVFDQVERLAGLLGCARSRIFADAAREYIARHEPDAITEAVNRVCAVIPEEEARDPAVAAAARRTLLRSEW